MTQPENYEPPPYGTPNHLGALLASYVQTHSVWREGCRNLTTGAVISAEEREQNRFYMDWTLEQIERYGFGSKLFAAVLLENWPVAFIQHNGFIPWHPSVLSAYLVLWAAVRDATNLGTKPPAV